MKNIAGYAVLALTVFLFAGREINAQSTQGSWSLDIAGGVPYTQFTVPTALESPEYGLGLRYNFSPTFALRTDMLRGIYKGTGGGVFGRDYRNEFYRVGLKTEFMFLRSDVASFAVFGGLEGFRSDLNAISGSSTPAAYEGEDRESIDLGFSAGATLRFRLSRYFDFMLEAEQHITGTRLFEGYDREITTGGDTFTQTYLDRFVSMKAGLTLKFGKSESVHKMWYRQDPSDEIARLKNRLEITEERLQEQNKRDEQLFTTLVNLQDSLSSFRSGRLKMHGKHSRALDSLQSRLNELQSDASQSAGASQEEGNTVDQQLPTGNYYIVASSFSDRSNAVNYARRLISRGINEANVVPPTQGSTLYKVSYTRGLPREEAADLLRERFRNINSDAWMMEYDGQTMSVE